MLQAKVTITVRQASEAASVVDIQGEITGFAESTLMDAYMQASAGNARAIILNFTGLEYMNSSGIGLLVTLLIRAQRQRQRLLAFGLSEHYRHIFELTGLNEAIRIYDTEAEALAAANG